MPPIYDFARFLNIRSAYGPDFLLGGRMTFLTDMTGLPQVWTVDTPGAWPTQVTFAPERILYASASHRHDRLVLGTDNGGDEHFQLLLLEGDGVEQRSLDPAPGVIHEFGHWAPDDRRIAYAANTRDRAFFDIYTLATDDPDAVPVCVYQQDGSNHIAAWAPDGSALLVANTEKPANMNLWLVPLDGGAPSLLTPHEGDAVYENTAWAPDGGSLYLVTDVGREYGALVRYDLATRGWETLAAPDWDVDGCWLSPDGAHLAYTVNADGYSDLVVRDLRTGADMRPEGLPRGVVGFTGSSATGFAPGVRWAPGGTRLAFNFQTPTRPLDVWAWDLQDGTLGPMTRSGLAGIPATAFVEPELVHYPTFDGHEIPAFLYLPPDTAGPVPCIVHVHGGPESQTRATFSPIFQYFVNRGYAVLAPNVRGSSGYGRTYVHLDDVRLRMDSVRDLAAGVEWLRAGGQVDPNRIAVMGGSYGGFMTLAAVTAYPALWAAGVDIVGIANFETFLENTGPWRRKLREAEYGSLEADREFFRAISPIHHVDKITAPLMVIHGANDPRVPVGEAEQIVAELRARRHPVEYLRFADEGHGVAKLRNRLIAYPAIGDFLDRCLKPEG